MSHQWTSPRPHAFREAYLDWSRLIGMRRDMLIPDRPVCSTEYAPVFVRLITGKDPVTARQSLRALLRDESTPLIMDSAELQMLEARITDPKDLSGLPDEYMLYRKVGTADSDHACLFEVLDSGVPVAMSATTALPNQPEPIPASPMPRAPIVALIDDGIGFLNARFCRATRPGQLQTRFHALWLQALEQRTDAPRGAVAGRILGQGDIDAMIASKDERASYATLNAMLFSKGTRRETEFGTTHGTHVLDLAGGADPDDAGDAARDWPLLGVQLPPEAIDDTSGTRVESYLVMGLRWILRTARQVDATAPVIVNLSLGILAGPKDGSRFAEYQIEREARLWEEVTGQPVRLVWAFGNGYRSSQVARLTFDDGDSPRRIAWRAQPEDETASFVEIHGRGAQSTGMQVGLRAPDGTNSGLMDIAPGEIRTLERPDGAALARLYHVPERTHDGTTTSPGHYVLALAPTRGRIPAEPEAPAGAWQIEVSCSARAEVLIQVQRDDAIRGSRLRGRQSYLDDPAAYGWDPLLAAYVAPDAAGAIDDHGTHNALVTATGRQVFSVGAAQHSGHDPDGGPANYHPAPYSGQGAAWSVAGPTAATAVGSGAFYGGLLATGTFSGSARRLSGTSAAAGLLSRALGLSAARILKNAREGRGDQMDDLDPALLIVVPTDGDESRLGAAIVDHHHRQPTC